MKLYSLRWYHLYFLLAAFSVTTVSFSLGLNHHLTSIFKGAVDTNLNYLELQDSLNQLGMTISTVNAPGNDIFDSHNVSRERTRLDESLIVANQRLQSLQDEIRALRDRTLLSEPEFLDFVGDLNRIKGRLSEMASEARLIFSLFENAWSTFLLATACSSVLISSVLGEPLPSLLSLTINSLFLLNDCEPIEFSSVIPSL